MFKTMVFSAGKLLRKFSTQRFDACEPTQIMEENKIN